MNLLYTLLPTLHCPLRLLAAADIDSLRVAEFIVMCVLGVFNVLLGVWMSSVSKKADKIDSLEDRLFESAGERIDEKFEQSRQQMEATIKRFDGVISDIEQRLRDGDGTMDTLANADHQIELKIVGKFDQLKDWMRDSFAGKDALRVHENSVGQKFVSLDAHLGRVETTLARLDERLPAKKGARE